MRAKNGLVGIGVLTFVFSTSAFSKTLTCKGQYIGNQVTWSLSTAESETGDDVWYTAVINDPYLYGDVAGSFQELLQLVPASTATTSVATIEHLVCDSQAPTDLQSATLIANCYHHRYGQTNLEIKDGDKSFESFCGNADSIPHMSRMPAKTLVLVDKAKNEVLWSTSYVGGCATSVLDYRKFNFYRENRFKLNDCDLTP